MKVNDYCEFPTELDMEPYTIEGITRREKSQERAEKGEKEDEENPIPRKHPDEYYKYRLRGVVVHSGGAEGGHYYSYIQDRESDKWHEFNDMWVSDFKESDIAEECFGGDEKWGNSLNYNRYSVKSRNAYLLFYERISDYEPPKSEDEAEETDVVMKVPEKVIKVPQDIKDMISNYNQKYWQSRFLFSQEYADAVNELIMYWNTSKIIASEHPVRNDDCDIYGINPESIQK
jgi:ubiquitin carboxyl-terminal hydrolase 9/24